VWRLLSLLPLLIPYRGGQAEIYFEWQPIAGVGKPWEKTPKTGPFSGPVFIWVKVTLGQNEFNPSVMRAEIREQTKHPEPTQETITRFCFCFPQSDPQRGVYWFVSERPWQTWNHHNATYEVKVYWNYMVPNPPFGYRGANPDPVKKNATLNLLLVSATPRYLLLQPPLPGRRTQLPRINLKLSDQQKGEADVFIQIYDPFSPYPFCPVRCISLTMDRPGSKTIVWDGRNNAGHLLPYGVYSYNVFAKVLEYPHGGHQLRSNFLRIIEDPQKGKETKYVQVCGNAQRRQVIACLGYWLEDSKNYPPTRVQLLYFDPSVRLRRSVTYGSNVVRLGYNEMPIIFPVSAPAYGRPTDGFHYILILPTDKSSQHYDRGHQSKDALPVGLLGVSHRFWINPGHGQGITGIMEPGAVCRQHNGQHQEHQIAYQLAVVLRNLLMRDNVFAHMVSDKRFVIHNRPQIRVISRNDPQFPQESGVVSPGRYGQRARWAWMNLRPNQHEPDWAHHIIVIHLNAGPETANGHEIYYTIRQDGSRDNESYPFSSRIHHFFDQNGIRACRGLRSCNATEGADNILRWGYGLFWWTRQRSAISASLLETVFITNPGDEDFILDLTNQALVAQCIHQGMDEHVRNRPRLRPR